jgi:hypothetical protein
LGGAGEAVHDSGREEIALSLQDLDQCAARFAFVHEEWFANATRELHLQMQNSPARNSACCNQPHPISTLETLNEIEVIEYMKLASLDTFDRKKTGRICMHILLKVVRYLLFKHPQLLILRREIAIEIEAAFADRDALCIVGESFEFVQLTGGEILRVVRVHAWKSAKCQAGKSKAWRDPALIHSRDKIQ